MTAEHEEREENPADLAAAKLAEEHPAQVLARALLLRRATEGKPGVLLALLNAFGKELAEDLTGVLLPDPPNPG